MLNEKHFKTLIYNGIDLRSFGLYLKRRFNYNVAAWNFDFINIAGKSGKNVSGGDIYDNVEEIYEFWMYEKDKPFVYDDYGILKGLTDWLALQKDYAKLSDSWHKDSFTYAVCTGLSDIKRRADGFIEGKIKFSRVPWWFSTSGQIARSFSLGADQLSTALINPTSYDSEPFFEFTLTGTGTVTFSIWHGDIKYEDYTITKPQNSSIATLDGETGDFKVDGVARNDLISFDKLPKLSKTNYFKSSSNTVVKVFPRWRRI